MHCRCRSGKNDHPGRHGDTEGATTLAAVMAGILAAALADRSRVDNQVINVELSQWKMKPAVRLKQGQTVRLRLVATDVAHGFKIADLADIQEVKPGAPQDVLLTARDPGTYVVYCSFDCGTGHRSMVGVIVVEA